MPADIETFEDQAAFVSYRELPWHRLGTTTDEALTAERALDLAHLKGWDVRKTPLLTTVGESVQLPVPDKFAIVRNNPFVKDQIDVLGVAGNQYAPVSNEEHTEFLNAMVDESGAHFETAGSIREGREVFISMKLPATLKVGGVDPVDTYLLAVNTHDATKSFRVLTTKVRVVCANTLAAALQGAGDGVVSIRHTAGAGGAVARARQALDLTFKYDEKFEAEAEAMINRELTNAEFDHIVKGMFPLANDASDLVEARVTQVRNDLHNLFTDSPTTTEIRGTAWAGYQAVTEWTDWFKNVPGKEGAAEVTARAENLMAGKEDDRKRQAFKAFAAAAHRTSADALVF